MRNKPDKSICVFGSGVLYTHLKALIREVEGVRTARDIEHIHRMRVASRRLRATLPLFKACYPAKRVAAWEVQIRGITRALGSARDLDVQIECIRQLALKIQDRAHRPGIQRLMLRLEQNRACHHPKVIRALNRLADSGIVDEMENRILPLAKKAAKNFPYSDQLYQLAYDNIQRRLEAFLSYEEFVPQPEKVEELHAMRIEAKRLRYTLETFAPLYPDQYHAVVAAVRTAQEMLGNIHDCDVWVVYLPQFIGEELQRAFEYFGHQYPLNSLIPGIEFLRDNRQQLRNQEYARFVEQWQSWVSQCIWQRLRQIIHLPLALHSTESPSPVPTVQDGSPPDEAP